MAEAQTDISLKIVADRYLFEKCMEKIEDVEISDLK